MKTTSTIEAIRKIMAVALAALILGAAFIGEAKAQDRIGFGEGPFGGGDHIGFEDRDRDGRQDRDRRRERDERDRRDRRPRLDEREVRINRYLYRESLSLDQLFQLNREARGTEVVRVAVNVIQPDGSLISLSADGRIEASQPAYQGLNVLTPRRGLEVGAFRRLNLDITGSTYVESIRITLSREDDHAGPGRMIEEVVNQRLSNGQVLDLAYVMRLYAYREFSISDIEIVGRTVGSYVGSVAFLVNNRHEAQGALVPGQSTHIFLRQPVAIYANSLLLQAQGDLIIERIRLRLEKR